MLHEISYRIMRIWWIRNLVILMLVSSLSIAMLIALTNFKNSLVVTLMILFLVLEILAGARDSLIRFYRVLNIVGSGRKIFGFLVVLNSFISMIPMYTILLVIPLDPLKIGLIATLTLIFNYLIMRRSKTY